MTDEELMRRYAFEADEASFAALYHRYAGRLYGYLKSRLPSESDRDAVFQEVFLKLHASRKKFQRELPFSPWFFTIARNTATDHLRTLKHREKPSETLDDVPASDRSQSESPPALESASEVLRGKTLSEDQRKAIE